MKPLQTLCLLASDQDFRLVHSHEHGLALVQEKSADAFQDVTYRYPGQTSHGHAGQGGAGFQVGGTTDRATEERGRFARHAVAALQAAWEAGSYDRIVIAAGPKMLGELRPLLPKALAPHVAAELHKDLMKVPLHDLPRHLAEVPGVQAAPAEGRPLA